jgi:ubiquinone/menaquinone biosynthesis C-methylase UbiE
MSFNLQVDHMRYFSTGYGSLERFISYFYQIDLATRSIKSGEILEIGVGDGMVSTYLKKLGYGVTGCDIDENLKPDVVADMRKLPFADQSFDVVMACEVLEHIPFDDFAAALEEMKRVSRKFCIVSVPYRSAGFEMILKFPFIRTLFEKNFLDFFIRIPLKFAGFESSGQHYWEIDGGKYKINRIREILQKRFKIIEEKRSVFDHYHYYFLLEK